MDVFAFGMKNTNTKIKVPKDKNGLSLNMLLNFHKCQRTDSYCSYSNGGCPLKYKGDSFVEIIGDEIRFYGMILPFGSAMFQQIFKFQD